jgi:hypothetical protein
MAASLPSKSLSVRVDVDNCDGMILGLVVVIEDVYCERAADNSSSDYIAIRIEIYIERKKQLLKRTY